MKTYLPPLFLLLTLGLSAQEDDLDALFAEESTTEVAEAQTVDNPEAAFFEEDKFLWAGDITGSVGLRASYKDLNPPLDKLDQLTERLSVDIGARLWFDARPDKNFRVFGKFSTSYPFTTTVEGASASYTLNNIQVFELFSDFNWDEKVFFRFGKQTAGWGLSRFYQIADPLSVGVKDPLDPAADLEGPLALKVSLPLGVNALYAYSVVKQSYLPANPVEGSIRDVGLGLKGDFLIPVPKNPLLGNMELTLGGYYQRSLAPKAVAGLSTGLGDWQIFTDQAVSWGLDQWRLNSGTVLYDPDGTGPVPPVVPVSGTEKPSEGLFYSATAGTMYRNNDWKFTLYGEYMFNAAASGDGKYLEQWTARYGAEQISGSGLAKTLVLGDLFGYLSQHNSGLTLSWSEVPFSSKVSFSALWLQNWVDRSGMGTVTLGFAPFEHFTLETGTTLSWGEDLTEWVIKNSDPVTRGPRRLSGFINLKLGGGRF